MTQREAGFTLIEVLVALALSAFVGVILLHGVRLAAFGLDRHTKAAERLDTRQALDELLRRTLGAAVLVPRIAGGEFAGQAAAVEFVAAAEDGGAGLYRITLGLDAARSLILRRRLATPTGDPREAASVLATKLRTFRLAYFGADAANATPGWHDSWQQLTTLPLMVRAIVDSDGDPPHPRLVVRLWNAG
jgi:prepilin-type N-terminal cleavage/methylation domain-containing protein